MSVFPRGNIYVPFIGRADIAFQLYQSYQIYGADINPEYVEIARSRLKGEIIVADCNSWPFEGKNMVEYNIADFDAYSEPYESFRSFWVKANKANKILLFFTDGHKQGIIRTGWHIKPDGEKEYITSINERRKRFNMYFSKYILPWFEEYVKPYKVMKKQFYLRRMMLYWGVVVEK
ncbi:MAG: hypothetical protein DDT41_01545 [candidate division WS2 bacterium]|nr:hypothetical protein [Candidatus Psychracetigena formicireducens]